MGKIRPGSKTFAIGLAIIIFTIAAVPSYIVINRKHKTFDAQVKGAFSVKPKFVTLNIIQEGVSVKTRNGNDYASAQKGQELLEGTFVRTDSSGRAEIIFTNGTTARLDSNSEVALAEYQMTPFRTTMSLSAGRIWSRVAKLLGSEAYQTKTNSLIAAVRGTSYDHQVTKDENLLIVTKGEILGSCINGNQTALIERDQWGLFDCEGSPKMGAVTEDVKDEWFKLNEEKDKNAKELFGKETYSDLENVKGVETDSSVPPKLQHDSKLNVYYFSANVKPQEAFTKFLPLISTPSPTSKPTNRDLPKTP